MRIQSLTLASALIVCGTIAADAGCVTKGAKATAGSESSAKWFVMETIVQQVSWGLWPGWVASGEVAGHTVKNERYTCKPNGGSVTCIGQATICTKN